MLKGMLKALDEKGMERLHEAALAVLRRTGLQIRGDFDPRMETIESSRLLLRNTLKPGWGGVLSYLLCKYDPYYQSFSYLTLPR